MKRRKQKKRGRGTMNALERRRKSKGRRFYKISNLIKMKTALEEEKGNHRLSNIKHKALLDEINNTMKEMDKLEKDVENKDKDKDYNANKNANANNKKLKINDTFSFKEFSKILMRSAI